MKTVHNQYKVHKSFPFEQQSEQMIYFNRKIDRLNKFNVNNWDIIERIKRVEEIKLIQLILAH